MVGISLLSIEESSNYLLLDLFEIFNSFFTMSANTKGLKEFISELESEVTDRGESMTEEGRLQFEA